MPFEPTTCPYCNAHVTVPERALTGQRVACPRCGETFSYRAAGDGQTESTASLAAEHPSSDAGSGVGTPPVSARRWSNRTIAGVVIGVMAGAAVVALIFALNTVDRRRGNDPKTPLGYLPPDTNIVAGVRVTEALKVPAGQDFLKNFRLGPIDLNIGNLERWTGLRRDQIQQVVVGLKIEGYRERLTLVVQTHEPYNLKTIREALKAHVEVQRGDKTLYRFRLENGVLEAHLWAPAERILMVGLRPEEFDPVPLTPRPGVDHFAEPIQAVLSHPMGEGSHVWLTGHSEHWDQTNAQWLISGLGGEAALAEVRTFGFWLHFDTATRFHAACKCGDQTTAQALAEYLVHKGVGSLEQIKVGKNSWVTADAETTPKAIRETLAKAFRGPLGLFGK